MRITCIVSVFVKVVLISYCVHADAVCVSTLSADGYVCETTPVLESSLVITGAKVDVGFLNDLIQDYIEMFLVSLLKSA